MSSPPQTALAIIPDPKRPKPLALFGIAFLAIFLVTLFSPASLSAQGQGAQAQDSPAADKDTPDSLASGQAGHQDPSKTFQQAAKRLNIQTKKGPTISTSPQVEPRKTKIPKEFFIGLGQALLVALLIVAVRAYLKSRKVRKKKAETAPKKEEPLDTKALLDTIQKADSLAREGKIVEAMHAVLLETIEELKRQKSMSFPSSHTSREIVFNLNLGDLATNCLSEIVNSVEPTWFGEYKPELSHYHSLRQTFDRFILVLTH
ncbi:MAG: hypothetical protein LBU69_06015 [Deltaproteobacteria bacterium]|jgi:hypothetical protein|nr:hypothetical protein [Deltaproteobacteria bacterium]